MVLNELSARLAPGGSLLAVHWRPQTRTYPLQGDEVHELLRSRPGLELGFSEQHGALPPRPFRTDGVSDEDRVVIVGAGPAGLSAARGYREAGGEAEVVLLGAEPHHPYERPPLTKEYLRGEHGRDELFMEPASRYRELGIDLRLGCTAAELDPGTPAVVTEEGEELRFGGCVLATGSEPLRLPVPGGDGEHLLTIREMEDSERLQSQSASGVAATVVGSGFLGCEAAASLAMRGCRVTLVSDDEAPHAARLGDEVGSILTEWLHEAGVTTRMGGEVEAFGEDGRSVSAGGEQLTGDVTVVAAGIVPRVGPGRGGRPGRRERAGVHRRLDAHERRRRVRGGRHCARREPHRRPAPAGGALGRGPGPGRGGRQGARGRGRRSGSRRPASGPRSASARSSTSPGATATTRSGSTAETTARSRPGTARTEWWSES